MFAITSISLVSRCCIRSKLATSYFIHHAVLVYARIGPIKDIYSLIKISSFLDHWMQSQRYGEFVLLI